MRIKQAEVINLIQAHQIWDRFWTYSEMLFIAETVKLSEESEVKASMLAFQNFSNVLFPATSDLSFTMDFFAVIKKKVKHQHNWENIFHIERLL